MEPKQPLGYLQQGLTLRQLGRHHDALDTYLTGLLKLPGNLEIMCEAQDCDRYIKANASPSSLKRGNSILADFVIELDDDASVLTSSSSSDSNDSNSDTNYPPLPPGMVAKQKRKNSPRVIIQSPTVRKKRGNSIIADEQFEITDTDSVETSSLADSRTTEPAEDVRKVVPLNRGNSILGDELFELSDADSVSTVESDGDDVQVDSMNDGDEMYHSDQLQHDEDDNESEDDEEEESDEDSSEVDDSDDEDDEDELEDEDEDVGDDQGPSEEHVSGLLRSKPKQEHVRDLLAQHKRETKAITPREHVSGLLKQFEKQKRAITPRESTQKTFVSPKIVADEVLELDDDSSSVNSFGSEQNQHQELRLGSLPRRSTTDPKKNALPGPLKRGNSALGDFVITLEDEESVASEDSLENGTKPASGHKLKRGHSVLADFVMPLNVEDDESVVSTPSADAAAIHTHVSVSPHNQPMRADRRGNASDTSEPGYDEKLGTEKILTNYLQDREFGSVSTMLDIIASTDHDIDPLGDNDSGDRHTRRKLQAAGISSDDDDDIDEPVTADLINKFVNIALNQPAARRFGTLDELSSSGSSSTSRESFSAQTATGAVYVDPTYFLNSDSESDGL